MLLALDEVARRYGSDPGSVIHWDPERLGWALMCIEQAEGSAAQLMERINSGGGMVFPVVVVR